MKKQLIWTLWSCGAWPRRIYEQWLRESQGNMQYGDPGLGLCRTRGFTNRMHLWTNYLRKHNVCYLMYATGSNGKLWRRYPAHFEISIAILKEFGELRITQ